MLDASDVPINSVRYSTVSLFSRLRVNVSPLWPNFINNAFDLFSLFDCFSVEFETVLFDDSVIVGCSESKSFSSLVIVTVCSSYRK